MHPFTTYESDVRSYSRAFPAVFSRAAGHEIFAESGARYLDFFGGAGALAYGHNPPPLMRRLIEYIEQAGVLHSLDMATSAKRDFLECLQELVLQPRGLRYKVLFPGPTGTNAVEAALKVARKATGRTRIYSFDGGFHGMTLGSLAVTSNPDKRAAAGTALRDALRLPFDGPGRSHERSLEALTAAFAEDRRRGSLPAAVILETVQCEGGVNVAGQEWLREVAVLARAHGTLLIVDDIQAGCGRTGDFFSFEAARIEPDLVCLSKALSGSGLPLAVVLLRPELDVLRPGEHNGTFRGNNAAFVTAAAALREYWSDASISALVQRRAVDLRARLDSIASEHETKIADVRGRGFVQGLEFEEPAAAAAVSRSCFERGLLIETAGHQDQVVKLLPPLNIPSSALDEGFTVLAQAIGEVLERSDRLAASASC